MKFPIAAALEIIALAVAVALVVGVLVVWIT